MHRQHVKILLFDAIIATRVYHVYKETKWSKVDDKLKVEIEINAKSAASDPYSSAIKTKHNYFTGWKTVGHILCEISRYVYFLIKQESGRVYRTLKSLNYKTSRIPYGGLEVPLLPKFDWQEKWVTDVLEEFVDNFYSYHFAGHSVEDDDNEGEQNFDFDTVDIIAEEDSGEKNE